MLPKHYRLTSSPNSELISSFHETGIGSSSSPLVGVYNLGMITVVDVEMSKSLLSAWSWLLSSQCRVLITTGFGDVFFWEKDRGVSFLEIQRGHVEFIDAEIEWFATDFLANPEVIEMVLRRKRLNELVSVLGELVYHNIFILEPWPMLGGNDCIENYIIGSCATYIELVGQSHKKNIVS